MLIFLDTEMQNENMYPKYLFFFIALEQMLPTNISCRIKLNSKNGNATRVKKSCRQDKTRSVS